MNPKPAQHIPSGDETINVWVIEDAHEYRRELVEMLDATPGISCDQSFGSVEEAMLRFRAGQFPQVVLVDIQLPGVNGIEAIKQLKEMRPGLHSIVLTISENRDVVFEAICAGASGYLLKNDPFDDIVRGIHLVFEGGSPLSGPIAAMVLDAFKHTSSHSGESDLNERETEVLRLLSDGMVKKEVAATLHIANVTVDYYLRSIYQKLQVHSQAGAVGKAIRKGLI
jgi:DNA-binding NarL/FixJ family response regulator